MAEVDAESEAAQISRSRLFALAVASYVEQRRRARSIDQYIRSYAEYPESDEELEGTDAFLRTAWADDDRQ